MIGKMRKVLTVFLVLLLLPAVALADLEVHFLDVGQGDCAVILCDGEAMVIEMDESGYLSMVDPNGNVRYIGVYDNNLGDVSKVATPNFRTYKNTTGNTKNQTTTIYKIG